jgi:hypothetical protein
MGIGSYWRPKLYTGQRGLFKMGCSHSLWNAIGNSTLILGSLLYAYRLVTSCKDDRILRGLQARGGIGRSSLSELREALVRQEEQDPIRGGQTVEGTRTENKPTVMAGRG